MEKNNKIQNILQGLASSDFRSLARAITVVENELEGYETLLQKLQFSKDVPVIGVTGPPGAGKSCLVNALLKELSLQNLKVAVMAVDPTSPFNFGSLLGDRLRMSDYFNSPDIFIRSMATRGSLGGLSAKAIEVTDLLKAAGFDYIIVESVGVGQSEVEIAGLADTTIVVLVPESGDEIQTFKAGVMEIADIFVINKADREGADSMVANIKKMLDYRHGNNWLPPVLKTIAIRGEGVKEVFDQMKLHKKAKGNERKQLLLAEKAYHLIQKKRMNDIDKMVLQKEIMKEIEKGTFGLYKFIERYY